MVPLETKTLLFRVRGGIKLAGGLRGADARTIKLTFVNAIKDLIPKVNSQAFSLTSLGSSLIIWPKTHTSTHPIEMQDETECGEILKFVRAEFNQQLEAIFKQRSTKVEPQKVVNLHFMFELGSRQDAGNLFIVHDKKSIIYYNMILPIDVVVFAQPEKPWGILQDQFLELITSQLSEMEQCIQKYADGKTIPIPQPFHFDLPEKATLVTVVYPGGVPEEILEPERRNLHRKHGLDNKPYFHRTMAYYFPSDDGSSLYIRNIHKCISLPDTKSFKGIYLVHGYYTYHHILEDHHNDVEWGTPFHCIKCVINWFRIQGYISKPLPSVGDLQKVQILLYPPHEVIVESIEWIGSTEIMGLLASFGISASTMVVQNTPGNFLDQGKIVKHFIKHGSPVIIYSFHQSYVLLGVAMSDVLENSRYLIMDPDITGIYEMAKIIEKAIEWKGGEFWEKLGPYNIFLPVRPEGI